MQSLEEQAWESEGVLDEPIAQEWNPSLSSDIEENGKNA